MISTMSKLLIDLVKLGVNISKKQSDLLKWRMSDDAKKYYTREENKVFYKELKKGNLKVVDAIRKQKQKRINALRQEVLNGSIILLICCILSSCILIPKKDNEWDINSLKNEEHTFKIKAQNIKLDGQLKSVRFDDNWYIVHDDFIKTFNENQDLLLVALEQTKAAKKSSTTTIWIIIAGLVFVFIFWLGIYKHKRD